MKQFKLMKVFLLILSSNLMAEGIHRRDEHRSNSEANQGYRTFSYSVKADSDDEDHRTEEARPTFGYRKPSGEYRVVDYLADEYGFARSNSNSKTNERQREVEDKTTTSTTTTTTSTTTQKPTTTPDYDDIPPPLSPRNAFSKSGRLFQEQMKEESIEQKQEQSDKLQRDSEPLGTSTPVPVTKGRIEIEREVLPQPVFVKPSPPPVTKSRKLNGAKIPKSLQNKISIHQLVSEAMPTLQMSVVPVYFVNKQTKSVMAIPYLVMKSISKMPLLPGMFNGVNSLGSSEMSPAAQNLVNLQLGNIATPHRLQRSNYRSGSNLLSLLSPNERPNLPISTSRGASQLRTSQETEFEGEEDESREDERREERNASFDSGWEPVSSSASATSSASSSGSVADSENFWWRK